MSKKYIIEIEDTPVTKNGVELWKACNFNSLVFDAVGLSRLVELDHMRPSWYEEIYQRGLDDAWEAARKIVAPIDCGGMSAEEIFDCFKCDFPSTFTIVGLTAAEAIAKLKEYEEKIYKIGSIICDLKTDEKYLIFRITDNAYYCLSGHDFEPVSIGKDYIHHYKNMNDDKDMDKLIDGLSGVKG